VRAPSSNAPASLDELVGAILVELDLGDATGFVKKMATEQVQHEVKRLRRLAKAGRPPLGEVADQMTRFSKQAQALADRWGRLPQDARTYYRWSVFGGAPFDPSGSQPSRVDSWLADLQALAHRMSLDRFVVKLQDKVAAAARHLMQALAPHVKLTRTKFYVIAGLLWEAATGESRKDGIRRACNRNIVEFQKIILKISP
jgi:hypothetical protein